MASMLDDWVPGWRQLRRYQRDWLRGDVVAGLTVAAYLIPQVMAYATVAGLPPVAGLWAALGPMAVYAFLGSSRQLSVGPESTTALMTATALAPLAITDPARYAAMAALAAILVGVICLIAGLARLGFLADLLSRPVLVGYMTGVALIMIADQLGRTTGVPVHGREFADQIGSFAGQIGDYHLPTVLLSAAVLTSLFVMRWLSPKFPGALFAVAGAALAVWLFTLTERGIKIVGDIPADLPAPMLPAVSLADVGVLLLPSLGIAVVAFSDNTLTARTFAARRRENIDANAELRALGVSNLVTGATQGFPVSSSGSRTALGDTVGSRTQLYSLVMLAAVVAVMLAGRDLLETIPMPALGALVVYAALNLIDVAEFRRIARYRFSELAIAVSTTVAVLVFGVLNGVLVAIALSILDLLRRVARPHDAIQGIVDGLPGMHDVDDYADARPVPGLVVYRYDAPLFFANAENFRERALAAVDDSETETRWFVLNAEANVDPDLTAADALEQLHDELTGRGIVFAMARVKQDLLDDLKASGFLTRLGPQNIYPTLPTAVAAYRARGG
ncbi:SulP family inorganic anion transporter [Mycolicibacterium brumae]|nr:SulP family inorganic anion transporter [Mycolicibacterium brumae]RWA22739.1 hypothetical protein MBRU_12395 [Mycolicibacterium brumae DSM 44177]UWW07456.1 SulP family inorganic anion transporter [Mycolicibacterium brumae]